MIVMGAENAMPSMARPTRSVAIFFASAQGMMKTTARNSVDTLEAGLVSKLRTLQGISPSYMMLTR